MYCVANIYVNKNFINCLTALNPLTPSITGKQGKLSSEWMTEIHKE